MAMQVGSPGAGDEPEVMIDINTTPLIDVMLVLLIMLIITIPIQLHAVNLQLPVAQPPPVVEEPPQLVKIDIDAGSVVHWQGTALPGPQELAQKIPYYHERHYVKPGLTGWAQLCYPYGASEKDALAKLEYDIYYVKNRSMIFDLIILLQTAEVVLWQKGSR